MRDDERLRIQALPLLPRRFSQEPEVGVAEIFQKNATGGPVVSDYFGDRDAVLIKKRSDIREIRIFDPRGRVLNKDDGTIRPPEAEIRPVGTPPRNGIISALSHCASPRDSRAKEIKSSCDFTAPPGFLLGSSFRQFQGSDIVPISFIYSDSQTSSRIDGNSPKKPSNNSLDLPGCNVPEQGVPWHKFR